MATNFPSSLDSLTNPQSSDGLNNPSHSAQHADANDAIEALQAKVGIDSSAVTTSHDYKIAQLEARPSTSVGDTPPSSPSSGNLWWDSNTGRLKIYYNDGDSSQWVDAYTLGIGDLVENVTLNGLQTLTNKTLTAPVVNNAVLQGTQESWNVAATAATGTVDFDTLTSTAWLYTSDATGNWTLNVRGDGSTTLDSVLDTGDSITVVFAVTQGATPYYASGFEIDGSAVTPEWQGGSAPSSGNASSIDAYVYTIIKTAATPTYTVLASQTQFA